MFKDNNIRKIARFYVGKIRIWATFLAPFLLWLLPATFFDDGESVCLSVQLAGIECYACGMTRAVMHFIHLDFEIAWEYNKIAFILMPIFFLVWVKSVFEIQGKKVPGLLGKYL
jgi:hypothetical protein